MFYDAAKESREFDDAMKAGYVTVNIVNALLLGMAGVGKTSVKHILLGLLPPDVRSSTALADAPIQIHIRDMSGVKVQLREDGWKSVEGDDLQKIVTDAISTIVSNLKHVRESKKKELQEQVANIASATTTEQSTSTTSTASASRVPIQSTLLSEQAPPGFQGVIANVMSMMVSLVTGKSSGIQPPERDPREILDSASSSHVPGQSTLSSEQGTQGYQGVIANIKGTMVSMVAGKSSEVQISGRDPREVLGSNWIYFTDSGGQPHFHNLLPHFLQGISAALFVHRLSERLDTHPMVEYYEEGRPISAPHRSPLTTEDTLKCLVRSMQTCSVDGEKPNLFFLGTFLDKLQESSETLEEKNEKLLKLLSSGFHDQLVFYDEAKNQLIFAVDAKHPGAQEEEAAKLIRAVVERSPSRKIKVPIGWYVLEIVLEKLTHHFGRKVLSKKECLEAAQQLGFREVALTVALKFFHNQHLFHYFPDVLPEVVFCSPQVLLDKLTELVKDAYIMREAVSNPAIASSTTVGKDRQVRDKGVVTLEFLEQFQRHYVDGLFTPPDLLQIFMSLLILTPFSSSLHDQVDFSSRSARYYMPSLLDMLSPSYVEKSRVFSSVAAPMIIRFPNGWPRSGVFCCLQIDLIQNRKWELVLKDRKPELIAQNCVMLSYPKSACIVTLIDSFSYIEVHIKASPSVCCRVCPLVRDDILLAIDASCRALRYTSNLPELAFFCPHNGSPPTDLPSHGHPECAVGIPQRHAALLLKEDECLKCTLDHGVYSQLQENHLIWIPDLPSAEGEY